MTELMLYILNFVLIVFESIVGVILADSFFAKRPDRKLYFLSILFLNLMWFLVIYFFGSILVLKIILNSSVFLIWIKLYYRANIIQSFFTALFLFSFLTIIDNIFLMVVEIITNINREEVFQNPHSYYLLCFSAKSMELLCVAIVRLWASKRFIKHETTWSDWLRAIFFPTSTLLISWYLLSMYYLHPELAQELLMCSLILLVTDVLSVFLINHMEKQQAAIRDNIILQQNIKLARDNISAWIEAYSGQRKQTHDFQNQLFVVRGMAKQQSSYEELVRYLDRLINMDFPTSLLVNTRRTVVDVILNQKHAIAKSKEIAFQTQLDDLSSFPLPDDALTIVLSNLIDNAIEACEKILLPEQRYILLKMQVKPEVSLLYIENSTYEPVEIHNNRVKTTKDNLLEHGYGLQNVTFMLERHGAIYALDYRIEESVFCFSAQI